MERIFTAELTGCSVHRMEQFDAISTAVDKLLKFYGHDVIHTHFAIIDPTITYFYWHTDKGVLTVHLWKVKRIVTVELHTKVVRARSMQIIDGLAKIFKANNVYTQYRNRIMEPEGAINV